MATLLWDSSALGKRYVEERGAETVDALFALGLPMVSAYLVYVANIIRRHRNGDVILRTGVPLLQTRKLFENGLIRQQVKSHHPRNNSFFADAGHPTTKSVPV